MTTKIKIGIVGSRGYTNKQKVKDLVFEIKEKYGDEAVDFDFDYDDDDDD